jgi:hypothetical protein
VSSELESDGADPHTFVNPDRSADMRDFTTQLRIAHILREAALPHLRVAENPRVEVAINPYYGSCRLRLQNPDVFYPAFDTRRAALV